ncbi:MAG: anaerobic ribonucleoside-triphosphate reductase activating protein [Cyanobacteria bacterium SIG29]|nr:anaerobic ribonucleoside-triphosphate reductase activating protein [Cyanobacteria bacterium SIG29]
MQMQFKIGGLQKTSLLDYPNKISAIVFAKGCNFNCGYCHNPSLLNSKEDIYSIDVFFEFLNKRIGKLDAVVITGGEATLQPDLIPFIKKIKELGFAIKLDTNGYKPEVLKEALPLIDYVAMDIKAPLAKYSQITKKDIDTNKISQSIDLIMNSNIDYEFRTTVLKSQLNYDDFKEISKLIKGAKKYYLQKFEAKTEINDETLKKETSYSNEEFKEIIEILKQNINFVELRN